MSIPQSHKFLSKATEAKLNKIRKNQVVSILLRRYLKRRIGVKKWMKIQGEKVRFQGSSTVNFLKLLNLLSSRFFRRAILLHKKSKGNLGKIQPSLCWKISEEAPAHSQQTSTITRRFARVFRSLGGKLKNAWSPVIYWTTRFQEGNSNVMFNLWFIRILELKKEMPSYRLLTMGRF